TGFGLLGHLSEMCEASNTSAVVELAKAPTIDRTVLAYYLGLKCVPGGTNRNWDSYGHKIAGAEEPVVRHLLADPQTSGGLLVAVHPDHIADFQAVAASEGFQLEPFGMMTERQAALVTVV
ncbi:MAG: AIR synthase-related protein, partial [Bacteroidota bacterium]